MPTYCSVPGCKNRGGNKFPKEHKLCLKWRIAIRRIDPKTKKLWQPGPNDVVCKAHFKQEDFTETVLGERSRLKIGAVPSVFDFKPEKTPRERSNRAKVIDTVAESSIEVQTEVEVPMQTDVENPTDSDPDGVSSSSSSSASSKRNESVQCSLLGRYSVDNYINDPKAIQYYTGFDDYEQFIFFFSILGPAVYELKYQCLLLSPKDQLFLTLMKLRQAKEDIELSFMFGISETTVSGIIITWINFMYFQLQEINIWPSKETVLQHMPEDFGKKFGTTRVILDATEIPIKKPSHVEAQSATWSSYKHRNTLKTMIGCTPRGAISYISDTYGGSVSDRQIIEKSSLLDPQKKMFERKDSIMADRGIMVQDLFATQDVYVNTPTMLKGKSQFEPEEIVRDRRISSKRIHIERIIGLSKTFKILKRELQPSKVKLGHRIVYICFSISNFRQSIVDENA